MKNRNSRLNELRKIIRLNRIENQDELLLMLGSCGYDVTQATLSRDLKALRVGKVSDGKNGYYYSLPEGGADESENNFLRDASRGIMSVVFSGNVGVVRTKRGYAQSVCSALDDLELPEILGTIAGEDTIFLVLREGVTGEEVMKNLDPVKKIGD